MSKDAALLREGHGKAKKRVWVKADGVPPYSTWVTTPEQDPRSYLRIIFVKPNQAKRRACWETNLLQIQPACVFTILVITVFGVKMSIRLLVPICPPPCSLANTRRTLVSPQWYPRSLTVYPAPPLLPQVTTNTRTKQEGR